MRPPRPSHPVVFLFVDLMPPAVRTQVFATITIRLQGFALRERRSVMLVAKIEFAESNDYLSRRMRRAFAFLRENDLTALSCGHHDIDGEDVYANVMEYDTVPAEEKKLEAHKRYYDVQCVASGVERVEVASLEGLHAATEYDEADDFALFDTSDTVTSVVLHAGEIAVLAPEDAHKPGCQAEDRAVHVKKVVVKVRA